MLFSASFNFSGLCPNAELLSLRKLWYNRFGVSVSVGLVVEFSIMSADWLEYLGVLVRRFLWPLKFLCRIDDTVDRFSGSL